MNPPLKFVAIAFIDYGGIGPVELEGFEFYSESTVVKPYFEELREKEEAAGGSGWDARKMKSEFLQRVSITIAKGNSRVLECIRHDWQSATAPDWVTVCTTHAQCTALIITPPPSPGVCPILTTDGGSLLGGGDDSDGELTVFYRAVCVSWEGTRPSPDCAFPRPLRAI
jgi:hypothetical protein